MFGSIRHNWTGLGHEVAKGIREAEREREYRRITMLAAEERNRRMAVIEAQVGKPVTSEDVESLVAHYLNTILGPGSGALLRDEDAGRIINALVMMNEELCHLRKITDNLRFGQDHELSMFAGVPVEEAIDRVLDYPEAVKFVPHICRTCKYRVGCDREMDYPNVEDMRTAMGEFWCANTQDNVCRWEFNGKRPEEPSGGDWVDERATGDEYGSSF